LEAELEDKLGQLKLLSDENERLKARTSALESAVMVREMQVRCNCWLLLWHRC